MGALDLDPESLVVEADPEGLLRESESAPACSAEDCALKFPDDPCGVTSGVFFACAEG
jgi:hypothetical protein